MSIGLKSKKRKTKAFVNDSPVNAQKIDITDIQLPRKFKECSAVVCNNQIHILGDNHHYRLVNGEWVETSTIPYPMKYDTAAIWFTNMIYVICDSTNYYSTYAWENGVWKKEQGSTIDTCHVVYAHIDGGGVIYALGKKETSSYHNFYKYTGTGWSSLDKIPYDFRNGVAVTYKGAIHVIGSSIEDNSKKHYRWDGTEWRNTSTLPEAIHYGKAVVYNNKIYAFNEDGKCLIYDGSSWTMGTPIDFGMKYGSAIVYNDKLYYMGGENSPRTFLEYNSQDKVCGISY